MSMSDLPEAVQTAIAKVDGLGGDLVQEVIRVASIASPTFHEGERAAYVERELRAAGLLDVEIDEVGNVWGVLPGTDHTHALLVEAHMDTVFGPDVDVLPRLVDGQLHGPGVRDNSAAVAGVIQAARLLIAAGYRPGCDVILGGTVGEEGRGDLRGMRALMSRHRGRVTQALAIDGYLGDITHVAVGSLRYLVTFTARGGHSWQDYGAPSAVHMMGAAIHEISELTPPRMPRTTLNVGVASGGTNVNVIAESAQMQVDVRSVDPTALADVAAQVQAIAQRRAAAGQGTCQITLIGERPAGSIPVDHPLVREALAVLTGLGVTPKPDAGSTNANIPLSLGIPAVAMGASFGRGIHTLKEHLDVASLAPGLKVILAMVGRLAG